MYACMYVSYTRGVGKKKKKGKKETRVEKQARYEKSNWYSFRSTLCFSREREREGGWPRSDLFNPPLEKSRGKQFERFVNLGFRAEGRVLGNSSRENSFPSLEKHDSRRYRDFFTSDISTLPCPSGEESEGIKFFRREIRTKPCNQIGVGWRIYNIFECNRHLLSIRM